MEHLSREEKAHIADGFRTAKHHSISIIYYTMDEKESKRIALCRKFGYSDDTPYQWLPSETALPIMEGSDEYMNLSGYLNEIFEGTNDTMIPTPPEARLTPEELKAGKVGAPPSSPVKTISPKKEPPPAPKKQYPMKVKRADKLLYKHPGRQNDLYGSSLEKIDYNNVKPTSTAW